MINMLSKERIEFLNRVQREGTNKRRYDLLDLANTWSTKHYDDTESIFIYDFTDEDKRMTVIIIMSHGEYIDYFIRQVI